MSSALDAFRAQREAVEQVHARLTEVPDLFRWLQEQVDAIAQNQPFATWPAGRAEPGWSEPSARSARSELPAKRSCVDSGRPSGDDGPSRCVCALASAAACGAGYAWAARPYEAELASLRSRVELLDFVGSES